ncbi:hypothetical protein NC653_002779 [Populus alba x Populus x berolinensis]|uniref:Uncharacterized protein n=1 Tax=Populus alba x Populus x berolinensis TaxID=444605 RepID=A0AAD6WHC4_9ROSI|nr:hypothetical protein NC653_002779 [Populus alba x Populus x berolinensis]
MYSLRIEECDYRLFRAGTKSV